MPFARLGGVEQRWTTDSRRLTPDWLPGEIIVERYEVFVPYSLSPGTYPLTLGYADMSNGVSDLPFGDGALSLALADVEVLADADAGRQARVVERALTNIGNDVALVSARVRAGLTIRQGVWQKPLSVRAGESAALDGAVARAGATANELHRFIHLDRRGRCAVAGARLYAVGRRVSVVFVVS